MQIPLRLGLLGPDGSDLALDASGATEQVLQLRGAEQQFCFDGVDAEPVPSLNRGFSAPVKLRQALGHRDRAFLMAHDSDPFNRWEAGQQYAGDVLLALVADLADARESEVDEAFVAAIGGLLRDPELDKAFVALACTLPGEGVLAEQMDKADPGAIHQARELMRLAIADRLKDDLLAAYRANQSNEPFHADAASAGRRAVKNMALSYLVRLDDPAMTALAAEQYAGADNMTDRMAALWALNDRATAERAEALDAFHTRYHEDPVVIDKWLTVQAMSSLPETLDHVRRLMEHPTFALTQPNKVRALIGAFCAGNPARFHASDGAGYRFLAEQVLALDAINPQVAARLATPLGRWRRYDDARQALMRAELQRILDAGSLSPDVYEIASKSLAG